MVFLCAACPVLTDSIPSPLGKSVHTWKSSFVPRCSQHIKMVYIEHFSYSGFQRISPETCISNSSNIILTQRMVTSIFYQGVMAYSSLLEVVTTVSNKYQ